jgi:hypothetical protein
MGHLILDLLRRGRLLPYVVLALPNFPPVDMPGVTALVTAMMMGNWFFSRPGTAREILQLPLSRKQLWRIRWILAFVVPLIILFGRLARLGIAAAGGRDAAFRLSWAVLIFLFQLSTLGILAVMSGPIRQRVSNRSKLLHPLKRFHDCFFFGVYSTVYVIVVFTAIGAAVALETPAYRQMAEWPAVAPLFLAVGLCVAAISFFHSPQIAPRSVVNLSPRESKGGNKTRPLTKSWMTGPAFFVWTQILTAVLKAMIFGSVFLFLWWILDGLLLKRFTMFSAEPHVMAAIFLSGLSIGGSSTDFLETRLRHLRVLPRSTRTLAAALTLLPVLSFVCHWVVPVAAYRMMSGHLPWAWALRLELLSVLAGVSSLLDSVALRAVGTSARFLPGLFLFMAAGFAFNRFGTPWPPATTGLIGLLGLAGIAASFLLNAVALRRSSSIYKSVFRLTTVSQPRWISE